MKSIIDLAPVGCNHFLRSIMHMALKGSLKEGAGWLSSQMKEAHDRRILGLTSTSLIWRQLLLLRTPAMCQQRVSGCIGAYSANALREQSCLDDSLPRAGSRILWRSGLFTDVLYSDKDGKAAV